MIINAALLIATLAPLSIAEAEEKPALEDKKARADAEAFRNADQAARKRLQKAYRQGIRTMDADAARGDLPKGPAAGPGSPAGGSMRAPPRSRFRDGTQADVPMPGSPKRQIESGLDGTKALGDSEDASSHAAGEGINSEPAPRDSKSSKPSAGAAHDRKGSRKTDTPALGGRSEVASSPGRRSGHPIPADCDSFAAVEDAEARHTAASWETHPSAKRHKRCYGASPAYRKAFNLVRTSDDASANMGTDPEDCGPFAAKRAAAQAIRKGTLPSGQAAYTFRSHDAMMRFQRCSAANDLYGRVFDLEQPLAQAKAEKAAAAAEKAAAAAREAECANAALGKKDAHALATMGWSQEVDKRRFIHCRVRDDDPYMKAFIRYGLANYCGLSEVAEADGAMAARHGNVIGKDYWARWDVCYLRSPVYRAGYDRGKKSGRDQVCGAAGGARAASEGWAPDKSGANWNDMDRMECWNSHETFRTGYQNAVAQRRPDPPAPASAEAEDRNQVSGADFLQVLSNVGTAIGGAYRAQADREARETREYNQRKASQDSGESSSSGGGSFTKRTGGYSGRGTSGASSSSGANSSSGGGDCNHYFGCSEK